MIGNKHAEWAETTEKTFGYLKITKVSFPNDTHNFTLQPAGRDDAPSIEIAAALGELVREFTLITRWLESLL
jgi:hypothetical protein